MTKFIVWGVALGVGVLAGVSTVVRGDDRGGNNFQVTLEGFQETPQTVSTTGRGRLTLRIDEDAEDNQLPAAIFGPRRDGPGGDPGTHSPGAARHRWRGFGISLRSTPVGTGGAGVDPATVHATSGDITGVIRPTDIIGPTGQGIAPREFAELVRAIRAGYAYGNVHTTRFPSGEIRGQIGDHDGHDGHD